MGFQWASLCARQFEALVAFIFQNYRNSFVKSRLDALGIKALKKQMVWPQNDWLLGLLYKSIVQPWASNGLLLVEDRAAFIFHVYCNSFVKARPEARGIKALKKQIAWPPNAGFWASYSNQLFHIGLPTGFSLWKTI